MSTHLVLRAPGSGRLLAVGNWGRSGRVWLVWQRPVQVVRTWGEVVDLVAKLGGAARVEVIHGSLVRRPDEPPEQQQQPGDECTTLPDRRALHLAEPAEQRTRAGRAGKHRPPREAPWRRYVVAAALLFAVVMLLVPMSCSPAHAVEPEPPATSLEVTLALTARLSGETTRWQATRADRSRWINRGRDHMPVVRRVDAPTGFPCAAAGVQVRPPAAALTSNGEQIGAPA